jgi:hypothetical protein
MKVIILLGLIVAITMGVIPPWVFHYQGRRLGYHPIWDITSDPALSAATIHYDILALQWIIVGLITFLFAYLLRKSDKNK